MGSQESLVKFLKIKLIMYNAHTRKKPEDLSQDTLYK